MDMEQRFAQLEEKIATLEHELDRVNSVNEIQRLMSKYMIVHVRNSKWDGLTQATSWKLFAPREDTTLEAMGRGIYVGIDKIRKMYEELIGVGVEEGCMYEHDLTTAAIVVAKDGNTARGLWLSPGHETDPRFHPGSDKPVAMWAWGKVQADFIRIDGVWYIWHYHFYSTFRCPFDESWVDYKGPEKLLREQCVMGKERCDGCGYCHVNVDKNPSQKPPSYHRPYAPDQLTEPYPRCPEPYDTWTDDRLPV